MRKEYQFFVNHIYHPVEVEQVTLGVLGKDNLKDWKIAAPREGVIPERIQIQKRMKMEELQRLEAAKQQQVAAAS